MQRRPKGQDVQTFNHMTEALRRGRRRIKGEYVPELTAWLLLHSYAYERVVNHWRTLSNQTNDPTLLQSAAYARHALSVIQVLINTLYEGFNKPEWERAKNHVSEQLGIEIGKPLPDVFARMEESPVNLEME